MIAAHRRPPKVVFVPKVEKHNDISPIGSTQEFDFGLVPAGVKGDIALGLQDSGNLRENKTLAIHCQWSPANLFYRINLSALRLCLHCPIGTCSAEKPIHLSLRFNDNVDTLQATHHLTVGAVMAWKLGDSQSCNALLAHLFLSHI